MPRKLLKRWLPHDDTFRNHKHLRLLGTLLHNPNIWRLNRGSVSGAMSVGLFMAWAPVPFQMLLAAAAAIIFRVYLPISVVLVWVTNPLTMPPMFYFAYKVGTWLLGEQPGEVVFELSVEWLTTELGAIWEPFLLGCLLLGITCSILGNLLIRLLWRLHVITNWRKRRENRRAVP